MMCIKCSWEILKPDVRLSWVGQPSFSNVPRIPSQQNSTQFSLQCRGMFGCSQIQSGMQWNLQRHIIMQCCNAEMQCNEMQCNAIQRSLQWHIILHIALLPFSQLHPETFNSIFSNSEDFAPRQCATTACTVYIGHCTAKQRYIFGLHSVT